MITPFTLRVAVPMGLCLLLPSLASAQTFQAPFGPNGTWNVYEVVGTGASFADALTASKAKSDPVDGTVKGTLVSVVSAAENTFINKTVRDGADTWIGLTDREGVAIGAKESQTVPATNQTVGWAWTSGEPFVYKNWGGGEPNDAGAPASGEDATQLRADGQWNDNASGYALNQPVTPTITPGTSGAEAATAFGYVIEYFKGSATPLPGIRLGSVLTQAGSIPGPSGGVGTWGVRELSGITVAGNILDAVNQLKGAAGTSLTAQLPKLDVADPGTNAAGGPAVTGTPAKFLTNGGNVDNIATIAKGTIKVTDAGTYTFQVHSDDGFALRVVGQNFTSVNGAGYMDPVDNSTMVFRNGTGDSDTRGVITLAAGNYAVEFVHFEGGGGAFYEVTSAKGAITNANGAAWIAVGDTTVLAANAQDVVRLTAAATVTNANKTGDNNLATAVAAVEAAITGGTAVSGSFTALNIAEGAMPIATTQADNYATKVTGKISLDNQNGTAGQSLQITFSLRSDDGSSLQILGQDFTKVADFTDSGVATLVDKGGDMTLVADYPTGNTDAFGLITLTEGQTYDLVAYHSEGGGGSSFQLWYAVGDFTGTGFDANAFRVLTTGFAANSGLALVPEPSTTGLFGLAALGLLGRRRRK